MMKLLTLNTHSYMETDFEVKLYQLVKMLVQTRPDIISLQEVNQTLTAATLTPDDFYQPITNEPPLIKSDNFAYRLTSELRSQGLAYYWTYATSHIGYDRFDEGVAILSRVPFDSVKSVLVSENDRYVDYHRRQILQAEISGVQVYAVHYSWWQEGFASEWQRTLENFDQKKTQFLLGDFNNDAAVRNEGYELVRTATLQDAFLEAQIEIGEFTVKKAIDGWGKDSSNKRIDYIFISQGTVNRYEVVFDGDNYPIVSDHFGVLVEVSI
ncbi:MAG: endonuclease/exonuclease/phosphatase family protein [Streptococcaceae bacterium]|jgi:maltose 6'-phosphate phosphatase|nr:endonuclease/exonuclease/phosphatase family protein [Streptococcaceae bacterium]